MYNNCLFNQKQNFFALFCTMHYIEPFIHWKKSLEIFVYKIRMFGYDNVDVANELRFECCRVKNLHKKRVD